MCQKEESYLALTTQDQALGQQYNAPQPTNVSHLQHQGYCSFMNHQLREYFHTNQNVIAHNTRSKRRSIEDVVPPPLNQALNSRVYPHVPIINTQPSVATQHSHDTNRGKTNESQTTHVQSVAPIVPKALVKVVGAPLNIVDHMKRTNVSVLMWDVFTTIPS